MFRKLVNKFISWSGWSPAGKNVIFVNGEGPGALQLKGLSGVITGVLMDGAQERILIEIETNDRACGVAGTRFIAIPRHKDFGSVALASTCIAVYILPDGGRDGALDEKNIIATMDLCISKS